MMNAQKNGKRSRIFPFTTPLPHFVGRGSETPDEDQIKKMRALIRELEHAPADTKVQEASFCSRQNRGVAASSYVYNTL